MTHEEHQAQLLDDYLTALQRNPDAPIPLELDPEMAQFAQMMVTPNLKQTSQTTQSAVWQHITDKTVIDSPSIYHDTIQKERIMTLQEKKKNESSNRAGILPLVASVVISVGLSLALAFVLFSSNDETATADYPNSPDTQSVVQVVTATPLSQDETQQVLRSTSQLTVTPTVTASATFRPTDSPLVTNPVELTTTAFLVEATARAQSTLQAIASPPTPDPFLECDFEGEFEYRLERNTISNSSRLVIYFRVINSNTAQVNFELFGGLATNDEYQVIETFDDNGTNDPVPMREETIVTLALREYPQGNYLVNLRLLNEDNVTLSSCGLPITVTRD